MYGLKVQTIRFVDSHQPGWVECDFLDVDGLRHTIVDKAPMFTCEDLDEDSKYPTSGIVPCQILERFRNEKGQDVVRVTIARPGSMQSTEGLEDFVVLAQLITSLVSDEKL